MTLLNNRAIQLLLLACLIVTVFWHGIWAGVPRADQLIYLHQMSGSSSLLDIIAEAPAWHRDRRLGDFLLFRPLLFLQLGISYYLFGYNFVLWQLESVSLHIATIWLVHACFWRTSLRGSVWPVLLCAPIAVSLHGAELVLWNHLGGYLLFALLAAASIHALLVYLDSARDRSILASIAFATLASFCYEAGTVLCFLVAGFFLVRPWFTCSPRGKTLHGKNVAVAAGFVIGGLLCPGWGLVDYLSRGLTGSAGPASALSDLAATMKYTVLQLVYWLEALILPWKERIIAGGRAVVDQGYNKSPLKGLRKLDAVAVLLVTSGALLLLLTRRVPRGAALYAAFGAGVAFMLSYSFIIAFGRAVPRGIEYVLYNNVYYAYIPQVALSLTLAVCAFAAHAGSYRSSPLIFWKAGLRAAPMLLALGLVGVTGSNAVATRSLATNFRYEFVPELDKVVAALQAWHRTVEGDRLAYFVPGPSCQGNVDLPWFEDLYFRSGSGWRGTPTFADVLFPDRSYALNKERLGGSSAVKVQVVECASTASQK